jgi:hypothetical protein
VPQEQPIKKKGASAKSSKKKEAMPPDRPVKKKGASAKASKRKETSE